MKSRSVVITIEAQSDLPLDALKKYIQNVASSGDSLACEVRQVKVQVVQAVKANG